MQSSKTTQKLDHIEVVSFFVSDMLCALECNQIQEILHEEDVTFVHHAPEYVRGVINLRGQIVTILELRAKLELPKTKNQKKSRIIVIKHKDEHIGLLVDRVQDILVGNRENLEPPPSHLGDLHGKYVSNILKMEKDLVAILNTDAILED